MPTFIEVDVAVRLVVILGAALIATACGGSATQSPAPTAAAKTPSPPALTARAQINDVQGQLVAAAVLHDSGQGVVIDVKVTKLNPGVHGIHIHAAGKCEAPGFASAGGHFNPTGKKHGHSNPLGPHAGDLGNLTVGPDGTGNATFTTGDVSLQEGLPNTLFGPEGTAMVIHANPDDETTDPAGNSGPRVGCGVISR